MLKQYLLKTTWMLRTILRNQFVRNIATLTSGQTIAQALIVAASPIITRLYDPDTMGVFSLLMSLSAPIVSIAGLRYELAIVQAKDDKAAANLLILSCSIVMIVSGVSVALFGLTGKWIAMLVGQSDVAGLIWCVPILVFVGGMNEVIAFWSTRRTQFTLNALAGVSRTIVTVTSQIVAGLGHLGSLGLVAARLLGSFVATIILSAYMKRDDWVLIKSAFNFAAIREVAKKYSAFPKYNAPHDLINNLSIASIPYTFAPFFGVEMVGLYFLTERVLHMPTVLISGATRRVFYQRACELHNQDASFYRLLVKTISGLFLIGILPSVLLLFFGPEIFSIVFGAEWRKAGVLAQWLVCWWLTAFAAGPAVESLTVLNLQKYLFYFRILFSLARVLSIVVGALIGNEITAVAGCAIVGIGFNLILISGALLAIQKHSSSTSRAPYK